MKVLKKFLILTGGGPILGLITGIIVSNILMRIHNNFVLEVNTTIAFSYAMFHLAEFWKFGGDVDEHGVE